MKILTKKILFNKNNRIVEFRVIKRIISLLSGVDFNLSLSERLYIFNINLFEFFVIDIYIAKPLYSKWYSYSFDLGLFGFNLALDSYSNVENELIKNILKDEK